MIVLGEAHLRRILKSYARYYNGVGTHRSLNKDAPVSRSVQRTGVIRSRAILGGLQSDLRFSVHTRASSGCDDLFSIQAKTCAVNDVVVTAKNSQLFARCGVPNACGLWQTLVTKASSSQLTWLLD
jgi:hypothetical protein